MVRDVDSRGFTPNDLEVYVGDARGRYLKQLDGFISASYTRRWLAMSNGVITVSANDPNLADLLGKGNTVYMRYISGAADVPEELARDHDGSFSGKIVDRGGDLLADGKVTVQIEGWWRKLRNTLAWVDPSAHLTPTSLTDRAQIGPWLGAGGIPPAGQEYGNSGYMYWPPIALPAPYPAGYALDWLLSGNFQRSNDRLGYEEVQPGGSELGGDVRAILPQVRFGTIESYAVPLLEAGDLGLDLHRDIMAPRDLGRDHPIRPRYWATRKVPQILTPESGIIVGGTWSDGAPTVTSEVIGGPGEMTARAFFGFDLPLDEWADHLESFRDATGSQLEWPDGLGDEFKVAKFFLLRGDVTPEAKAVFQQAITDSAAKGFYDGRARSGVKATLATSQGFAYAAWPQQSGFLEGDVVEIAGSAAMAKAGVTFEARITEVTVTKNRADGVTVTPSIGGGIDTPQQRTQRLIAALVESAQRRATGQ